jgi:hypothetical protein
VEDIRRGVSTNEKRPEENAEKLWISCCTDKQFRVGGMDHMSNLEKGMARKNLISRAMMEPVICSYTS